MSARSRQAKALARELSETTGVHVEIRYADVHEWLAEWQDGPTRDQMAGMLAELQESGRYPEMAGQTVRTSRSTSDRAWAALAVAADREGTLRPKVAAAAAARRANSLHLPAYGNLTHDDHALLNLIEDELEVTAYPERAASPEDEPVIQRLVEAGEYNIYRMCSIILAGPVPGVLPEGVTPLHRPRNRRND